jgi:GTP-binding protein
VKKPQVVVVGRPNVGKSSLVNRLVGKRIAVVEEQRGVTRDRKAVDVEWRGLAFEVVDTGGWLESGNTLEDKVSQQAEAALASADLVLLVVDAATGPVEEDSKAARWVRKSGRPVMLVVNKVDDQHHEAASWEFLSLGAGEPVMVSAQHGRGAGDLLDHIVDHLGESTSEPDVEEEDDGALRVAIVGRPNVGKSTLFNQLIGEERSVVHDMPGTTRDAIDTLVDTSAGLIRFIDTAGMRKRARTEAGLETYSVLRSLDALDRADIAILVIDATDGATGQDQRLAERISASGCPALVVLNKWELVATEDRDAVLAGAGEKLAFLGDAPVLKTTALSGKGVHRLLPALSNAAIDYAKRVPTGALNRAIRDLQIKQPAPTGKIRYAVQGATEPPTFTLFVAGKLPSTYLRYVERSLRERFELGASPIRVRVRVE